MKFIFPKNYRYRAKILGIIDYVTAIVDSLIGILLFFIIRIFIKKITTQIYIFVILFLPILLFSVFVSDGENIITYTIQIIKFIKKRGIYFYDKK